MQKKLLISVLAILVAGISVNFVIVNNAQKSVSEEEANTSVNVPVQLAATEDIKWYSMTEALAMQEQSKKKLFVDVYTTWCGPCKFLSTTTFTNPVIAKAISEYYIPVKFDAEGKDTISYKGKEYVNPNPTAGPRQSTHQLTFAIAQTQQGIAYPTMVFMDENQDIIQPISGALSATQLEPILSFFGTDAYKNISWDDYLKSFQSQITSSN